MITLVIPVYNMEQYLPRCMKTVLVQTRRDFEVVLVDDGSTDCSGKMCDEYAKEYTNLITVVHKQNGGLSSARNAGIDAAKGEYIVFPDPDDWLEPDYVASFLELLDQYNSDLNCVGHYVEFDDRRVSANEGCSFTQLNQTEARRALLINPKISGFAWNKLYKLDIIRDNGLRFLDDVGTTEDLDFSYRYLTYCKNVCFAPNKRVYHYYQRPGAATHSGFTKHKLNSIHTYEKIIADTDDAVLRRAAEILICDTAINLLWAYKNAKAKDKDSYQKLKNYLKQKLSVYLNSSEVSRGRKLQAIIVKMSPSLYCMIKNMISKG